MGALPDGVVIERCSNLLEVYYTWPGTHTHTHRYAYTLIWASSLCSLKENFCNPCRGSSGRRCFRWVEAKQHKDKQEANGKGESSLVFRLWPLKGDRIMICKLFITVLSFFVAMWVLQKNNKRFWWAVCNLQPHRWVPINPPLLDFQTIKVLWRRLAFFPPGISSPCVVCLPVWQRQTRQHDTTLKVGWAKIKIAD